MTQALDIVSRSLRAVGAYAAGEPIDPADANDALDMLNDLVDTWSNSTMMIPYVTEIIFQLQTNVYNYTIGKGGTIGSTFTGSIAQGTNGVGVLTVTALATGANIAMGQFITGGTTASGTHITEFLTGAGGQGTYEVNISQVVVSGAMQTYYQRPMKINSAFVRVATLDYPVYPLNIENYEQIGLKTLAGPWPRALYYQPSNPVGNITLWPVPTNAAEMHIFAETVLSQFSSLADTVVLPQGYNMALRWCLAELLLPEYGKNDPVMVQLIKDNAKNAKSWIKRTNMSPPASASFDPALLGFKHGQDPSWILSGGFLG
jgi:hypothetical protein